MIEDPRLLLGRLKLGREEYCQRLLTMLILDGPYPLWNTPCVPSAGGLSFLASLDQLSFGESGSWSNPIFVDELDLPRRHDRERGGAPDQSLHDAERLWLIELKTEAASHRASQIPTYFDLARHHYSEHRIDITYLTGPLSKPPPQVPEGSRYAHVTWADVMPLIHDAWPAGSKQHSDVVNALDDVLRDLVTPWLQWRAGRLASGSAVEPITEPDPISTAVDLARLTADDRRQRALDHASGNLEDLQALRLDVQRALGTGGSAEHLHVRPWLWRRESQGQPMTDGGREAGYELRLSWYQKPTVWTS